MNGRWKRHCSWAFLIASTLTSGEVAAKESLTPTNLVNSLQQNISAIGTVTFTRVMTVVNRRRPSDEVITSFIDARRSTFDRTSQTLKTEMLNPPKDAVVITQAPGFEPELAAGIPLAILNPSLALLHFNFAFAASSPAGHRVIEARLKSLPQNRSIPQQRWLVRLSPIQLVSVTTLVETGEVGSLLGFEAYQSFLSGNASLPMKFVQLQFAQKNQIRSVASYQDVVVTQSSGTGPASPGGPAEAFVIGVPSAVIAQIPFSLTVTAVDKAGQVAKNFRGTVAFASLDPLAQLPPNYTFRQQDQGQRAFSASLGTEGVQMIQVRDASRQFGPSGQAFVTVLEGQRSLVPIDAGAYQGLDFFGAAVGWVVGSTTGFDAPVAQHLTGQTWARVPIAADSACVNYNAAGVSLSSTGSGWMAAVAYTCSPTGFRSYRYALSGTSWSSPQLMPSAALPADIALPTPQDGWQSAYQYSSPNFGPGFGVFFRFDGSSWSLFQSMNPGESVGKIKFVRGRPEEGWAIASSGLLRFRGLQWIPAPTPSGFELVMLSLCMIAPNDVWAGSFGNSLFHFDGTTWVQVASPAGDFTAFADIAFFDAQHGVAVGAGAGFGQAQLPVLLFFSNGVWQEIPVMLPPGFATLALLEVQMTRQDEAWVIGIGLNVETLLDQPVLLRIVLPGGSGNSAQEVMAASAPISSEITGPLQITDFSFSITGTSVHGAACRFAVNERSEATLTIYTSSMRSAWTRTLTAERGENVFVWDGQDEPAQGLAASGWYVAHLEIRNSHGRAMKGRHFALIQPGRWPR